MFHNTSPRSLYHLISEPELPCKNRSSTGLRDSEISCAEHEAVGDEVEVFGAHNRHRQRPFAVVGIYTKDKRFEMICHLDLQ